jgi:hypothetical protein
MGFDGFSLVENTLKTSRIMNEWKTLNPSHQNHWEHFGDFKNNERMNEWMKNPKPISSKPLRTLWRLQE